MDSDSWPGLIVLAASVITLVLVVAAEAAVLVGARARAMEEPVESRLKALRRYVQERQATLSALALARSLTMVGITAIVVFLVLQEAGHSWAILAATAFGTFLALMLVQAFPRLLVHQSPQRWHHTLEPFLNLSRRVLSGPARLLDLPVMAMLRWWQREPQPPSETHELLRLAELEGAAGIIPEEERQMILGIMEMEQTTVREVMVPRTDIVAADVKTSFEEVAQLMVDKGHSRLPVYEGTIDNVVGVVYGKDILRHLAKGTRPASLREIARPVYFVPESKKVAELLAEMRQRRLSIAIVVDEYGGTAGLATLEDLLEEIVGEIEDEFDIREQEVQVLTANEAIVDARAGIDALNEMFDVHIQKDDFDSVGGLIFNSLGRMPSVGDEIQVNGLTLKVLSVSGRRIKKVRVIKHEDQHQERRQAI